MKTIGITRLLAIAAMAAAALWLSTPAVKAIDSATVSFYSQPPGAEVYLDNVRLGLTPLTFWTVPAGSHQVRYKKAGYSPTTFWFNAKVGAKLKLNRNLRR